MDSRGLLQHTEGAHRRPEGAVPHELLHGGGTGLSPQAPAGTPYTGPASLDGRLLRLMLQSLGDPAVRVSLWNGETVSPAGAEPLAHVRIGNRASLLKLLADPEFQFGECFCDGSIEVEGDLVTLLEKLIRALSETESSAPPPRRIIQRFRRRRSNATADSRNNIQHHYDLATRSTSCGSTGNCRIPAPIFRRRITSKQRDREWTMSPQAPLQPGRKSWRRVAAGARWRCTWPPTMVSGQGLHIRASRSPMRATRARAPARPARRYIETTTAASAGASMPSFRSACSSIRARALSRVGTHRQGPRARRPGLIHSTATCSRIP